MWAVLFGSGEASGPKDDNDDGPTPSHSLAVTAEAEGVRMEVRRPSRSLMRSERSRCQL